MFEYSQGYEIDGSDSSYFITMPEKEKCFEILKYYFSLKIIHKGKSFKIIEVFGKDKLLFSDKIYNFQELYEFLDIVSFQNIDRFTIVYAHVNPSELYPEVKREIIDTLFEIDGIKDTKLINPAFKHSYTRHKVVTVILNPAIAKKWYVYGINISSESYINTIIKNDFFFIDFNCTLGGSYYYYIYSMAKLAKRFPELDAEVKKAAYHISYDSAKASTFVFECIEIESFDFYSTIKRIISNPAVILRNSFQLDSDEIFLSHVPRGFGGYGKNEKRYEFSKVNDGTFNIKSDTPYFDILKGIYKENPVSILDYVEGVEKLSKIDCFSDGQFEIYTAFYICVNYDENDKYGCEVKFTKKHGKLSLCILVPFKKYKDVKKKLGI